MLPGVNWKEGGDLHTPPRLRAEKGFAVLQNQIQFLRRRPGGGGDAETRGSDS